MERSRFEFRTTPRPLDKVRNDSEAAARPRWTTRVLERSRRERVGALWQSLARAALPSPLRGLAGLLTMGVAQSPENSVVGERRQACEASQRLHRLERLSQTLGDRLHGSLWQAFSFRRTLVC